MCLSFDIMDLDLQRAIVLDYGCGRRVFLVSHCVRLFSLSEAIAA